MKRILLFCSFLMLSSFVSAQPSAKPKKQLSKVTKFWWDDIFNRISTDTAQVTTVEWSATGTPLKIVEKTDMGNGATSIYIYTDFIYKPGLIPDAYYIIPDWQAKNLEVRYENADTSSGLFPVKDSSFYDSEGRYIRGKSYNFLNGSWVLKVEAENIYDFLGNYIGYRRYDMVSGQPKLNYGQRYTNEYNSQGDLIKIKIEKYENDKWVVKNDKQVKYDNGRGMKAFYGMNYFDSTPSKDSLVYEWHRYIPQYQFDNSQSFKIDRNLEKSVVHFSQFTPDMPLEPFIRYEYSYNAKGLLINQLDGWYSDSIWEPSSKIDYAYYANGDLKYKIDSVFDNFNSNIWEEFWRETFDNTYDADGDITSMIAAVNNVVHYKKMFEYNNTYSIPEQTSIRSLTLYPNPAGSTLNIDMPQGIPCKLTITDLAGRMVLTGKFTGSSSIDISSLETGTYIAIMESSGEREYRKFIKQ